MRHNLNSFLHLCIVASTGVLKADNEGTDEDKPDFSMW